MVNYTVECVEPCPDIKFISANINQISVELQALLGTAAVKAAVCRATARRSQRPAWADLLVWLYRHQPHPLGRPSGSSAVVPGSTRACKQLARPRTGVPSVQQSACLVPGCAGLQSLCEQKSVEVRSAALLQGCTVFVKSVV